MDGQVSVETVITPIERRGDVWVKRDDLFEYAGVCGGKVRTCVALASGARGLITAGSRQSPQVNIVAHIAASQGIPARLHVPSGPLTPELEDAIACGPNITLVRQYPGYNTVIVKRARGDAEEHPDFTYIPFGMECPEAIKQTAAQVRDIPAGVKRIVVPVGSGMSLAGIITGMIETGWRRPILGVQVGADPIERIEQYAPQSWRNLVRFELRKSDRNYHKPARETAVDGLELDPIYEAKCIPFLEPDDLLWVVGIRVTSKKPTPPSLDALDRESSVSRRYLN